MTSATDRIVITGAGVGSPFGLGAAALHEGMMARVSAVGTLPDERDALRPGYGAVAQLTNKQMRKLPNARQLRPGTMTRYTWLSTFALGDAMIQAEAPGDDEGSPRRGMYVASYTNTDRFDKYVRFAHHVIGDPQQDGPAVIDDSQVPAAIKKFTAFEFLKLMNNMPTAHGGIHANCQGPVNTFLGTAAGGLQAMSRAVKSIQDDLADLMYAGGTGSAVHAHLMMVRATRGLNADPEVVPFEAGRPWDQNATGIVPGEAAGMLVLEREESARARGAAMVAELAGWGDSFGVPGADRAVPGNSDAAVDAMLMALEMARVRPGEVDLVCSGGESRLDIDALEAEALPRVLGERSGEVPHLSTTAHIGSVEAATGPVLVALALEAMKTREAPPDLNRDNPIAQYAGPLRELPTSGEFHTALVNVTTREGVNAAVVLKRIY